MDRYLTTVIGVFIKSHI